VRKQSNPQCLARLPGADLCTLATFLVLNLDGRSLPVGSEMARISGPKYLINSMAIIPLGTVMRSDSGSIWSWGPIQTYFGKRLPERSPPQYFWLFVRCSDSVQINGSNS